MSATLTLYPPERPSRCVDLAEGPTVVIGRDPSADIVLPDACVSRRHARVSWREGTYTLEDLGSKNGTYLNRRPVTQPVALHDGDRIQVGSVEMTYRIAALLPSTITRHI
jgi:pSer/pThr/pTyr-binding forkhead associated (FHA) protein